MYDDRTRSTKRRLIILLDINKIYEARERIKDVIVETPFSYAPFLSEMSSSEVYS